MEKKITIGIEKRFSLYTLEMAIRAQLDGSASPSYYSELAHNECTGANRAKKVLAAINRMTTRSELTPYLVAHKEEVESMFGNRADKPLLYAAVLCCAYTIFYDTVANMGKFFHVQEQISREFLLRKLGEKYGHNRALDVAFDCIIPMLMEAGLIKRPKPGIYEMVRQEKFSEAALAVYQQAFLLNNPNIGSVEGVEDNPFFEFLSR